MKNFYKVFIFLIFYLLSACHVHPVKYEPALVTKSDAIPKTVVLVSLDGFRFDYPEQYHPPRLTEISQEGVRAEALIPCYPSKTFPNHWSIITGLYPGHHGIVANTFYDPAQDKEFRVGNHSTDRDSSWYGGIPLWSVAEQQGVRTAIYFWPGSDSEGQKFPPSEKVTFDDSIPAEKRIAQVIDWLKRPESERPRFLSLYFSDVDTAGHRFGPLSEQTRDAVLRVDRWVGTLWDELKKLPIPIDLMIVSDHGMEALDAQKTVYLDDYLDVTKIKVLGRGPQVFIYRTADTTPEVVKNLEMGLKKLSHHIRSYRRDQFPEKFHLYGNPRAGDWLIEVDSPYSIRLRTDVKSNEEGNHGYDPELTPNMKGIFLASGPDFKTGKRMPPLNNIDVFPAILKILQLSPIGVIDGNIKSLKDAFR